MATALFVLSALLCCALRCPGVAPRSGAPHSAARQRQRHAPPSHRSAMRRPRRAPLRHRKSLRCESKPLQIDALRVTALHCRGVASRPIAPAKRSLAPALPCLSVALLCTAVALLCAAVAMPSTASPCTAVASRGPAQPRHRHAEHRIAVAGLGRSLPCRRCQWSAQPSLFRACPCQSSALLGIAVAKLSDARHCHREALPRRGRARAWLCRG